jgi:hypothetical protein
MTNEQTDAGSAKDAAVTKEAKQRSPIERAIVWGGILAMLIVVIIEGRARLGYGGALSGLKEAIQKTDEAGEDYSLSDAETLLSGATKLVAPDQGKYNVKAYQWKGLFKSYTIRLQTTPPPDQIVLAMDSIPDLEAPIGPLNDPAYAPKVAAPSPDDEEEDMSEMGGGGHDEAGPGGGPGGGQRQRRSFEEMDADADGKISLEEAPGRMGERFEDLDANGDGGIDKEELDAARQRFMNGRRPQGDGEEASGENGAAEDAEEKPEMDKPAEDPEPATPKKADAPATTTDSVPATEPDKTDASPSTKKADAPTAGEAKDADEKE